MLADLLPYIAEDAVILAIVEPGVGKDREIAVEAAGGRVLVGPDNGLLSPAWKTLGGVGKAVRDHVRGRHCRNRWRRRSAHATPTARRRLISPPACRSSKVGPAVDPSTLVELALPEAGDARRQSPFRGRRVQSVREHQARTCASGTSPRPVSPRARSSTSRRLQVRREQRRGNTYADFAPGEYGVIVDPRGWLMVVRGNPDSALQGLGLATGDPVWISGQADAASSASPSRTYRVAPTPR